MLRNAIIVATVLLPMSTDLLAQARDIKDIKTPPLRQVSMPQPKRIQLPNGMVIFLQEDHELPLISGTARIRGGSREEPAAKTGLVDILGTAWRTGGTKSKTGDELDDSLEARAARLETGGDDDSTIVGLNLLKGDFDAVFPIFVDLLRNPAFRQDKIDLAKTQANTGISRRNDEPSGILSREAAKLGYGADSPYARQTEYSSITSITREDLLAFHQRFVHPNNIILGLVGDFDSAQMEKKLRQAFTSWSRGPQAPPPVTATNPAKPGVYFIAKDDVTQANIAMVHPGISRNTPDYPAVVVMNEILGGGFSGRLMGRLRSERGLTYGVGGSLGTGWDHPGIFSASMATKSGTTLESIDALRTEIGGLLTQPFTPAELSLAKEAILNSFIFTLDSRAKLLSQRMNLEFYGYPADYFQKYPGLIEKVTGDDVSRVAKKYITPDRLAVLVVGKESDFEKPLSSLGTVTAVDITIPEPGAPRSAQPTSVGNQNEGAALVRKVQDFAGGKAAFDRIQAVRTMGSMSRNTPQGMMDLEVDALTSYPNRHRMIMKMPMGEMTMVLTPESAFAVMPGMGVRDMPGSQRDAMRNDQKHDFITILKHVGDPSYTFAAAGTQTVGDIQARVLEINADGAVVKWLVDPATGRVLQKISTSRMPGEGEQITEFTEWKEFGGIRIPTAFKVTAGGQEQGGGKLTSVEINPAIDAKVFEKPSS